MTTFHEAVIQHGTVLDLAAFTGRHPECGDMTARAVIPLRHVVKFESAPANQFERGGNTGWENGDKYLIHTIDGKAVALDFSVYTNGDVDAGITGDSGQAFTDFSETMMKALAELP